MIELNSKSNACIVKKVEIDVTGRTYCVSGIGFPIQTITFNDFSDWDTINGDDGLPILDCQIDYDDGDTNFDGFQFQCVDLEHDIDGDYVQGGNWHNADLIEVVNCDGFDKLN